MKKEFLIVIIANFIFCFLLPATAIPLFFRLLDPIEDSSSITLLMILVVCFATMLFVFMSLLPRTLNEKTRYPYVRISAYERDYGYLCWQLGTINPNRNNSRHDNDISPMVAFS